MCTGAVPEEYTGGHGDTAKFQITTRNALKVKNNMTVWIKGTLYTLST